MQGFTHPERHIRVTRVLLSLQHSFNLSAPAWTDVTAALPLQYQFVIRQVDTAGNVQWVPLTPSSSSSAVTNVLLPVPQSGDVVTISVIVQNAFGAQAMPATAAVVTLSQPTLTNLLSQLSSVSTGSSPDNSTTSDATNTTSTTNTTEAGSTASAHATAVLTGAKTAIDGLLSTASTPTEVLDVTTLTFTVLQVTACASVQCGSGRCSSVGGAPVCVCDGTGFTGPYCNIAATSTNGGSSSSTPTPTPTSGSEMTTSAAALKACPSMGVEECSGHGTCVRSPTACTVSTTQCVAVCRWVSRSVGGALCSIVNID